MLIIILYGLEMLILSLTTHWTSSVSLLFVHIHALPHSYDYLLKPRKLSSENFWRLCLHGRIETPTTYNMVGLLRLRQKCSDDSRPKVHCVFFPEPEPYISLAAPALNKML